jgi:hypothetical protein
MIHPSAIGVPVLSSAAVALLWVRE